MSAEVEKSLLGCALATEEHAIHIASQLTPEEFADTRHGLVFRHITEAINENTPTDTVSISARMGKDVDRIGGPMGLFSLVQAAQPASISHQIATVRKSATRRRLKQAGLRIQTLADSPDVDFALAESAQVLEAVSQAKDTDAVQLGGTVDGTLEKIRSIQDGTAPAGLQSGFVDLDNLTNGFNAGQMVIVAARPGVGKSTLAVDIMRNLSIRENVPTLMFSLEMSQDEINERILAAETEVNLGKIKGGRLSKDEWAKLDDAKEKLRDAPIFIDSTAETTITDITTKTKMHVKKNNVGLVVIDYLQLISSGSERVESRQQEVSGWSRQIKLLAKATGVPVIAVAQLNRQSETRDNHMPKASDLRESGALEQDADIILLLHRDSVHNPDSEAAGTVDVIVAKNRGGRTGKVSLADQLHYGRFTNFALPH